MASRFQQKIGINSCTSRDLFTLFGRYRRGCEKRIIPSPLIGVSIWQETCVGASGTTTAGGLPAVQGAGGLDRPRCVAETGYCTLPKDLSAAPAGAWSPAKRQPWATGPPGKIA